MRPFAGPPPFYYKNRLVSVVLQYRQGRSSCRHYDDLCGRACFEKGFFYGFFKAFDWFREE
jgi:hypothetical protein